MRPVTVSAGPLAAAVANNIALSQTPGAAGALTLNGSLVTAGVAILDNPRRVLFTTVSDEHTKTFTVTGTNAAGSIISETVTGPNATTGYTVLDYKTVTSITVSAALTGAVTVGTNGIGGSLWVRFDEWAPSPIAIQTDVSGTVNYTIQQTLDDPNSATNPVTPANMTWINHPDANLVSATAAVQGNYAYMPVFARILLNSSTSPGNVTATFIQTGVTPR